MTGVRDLETIDLESYRREAKTAVSIQLDDKDEEELRM
jgi:hypothetical protein